MVSHVGEEDRRKHAANLWDDRQLWSSKSTIPTQPPPKVLWCIGSGDVVPVINIASLMAELLVDGRRERELGFSKGAFTLVTKDPVFTSSGSLASESRDGQYYAVLT